MRRDEGTSDRIFTSRIKWRAFIAVCFCFKCFLIGCGIVLVSARFSSAAPESRLQVVTRTLDRLESFPDKTACLDWQDSCGNYSAQSELRDDHRTEIINGQLDQIEKDIKDSPITQPQSEKKSINPRDPARLPRNQPSDEPGVPLDEKFAKPSQDPLKKPLVSPLPKDSPSGPWKKEVGLKSGYRNDYLRWNIAGDISGAGPNILSELTWEDLHIFQLQGDGRATYNDFVRLEGLVDYGWIVTGKNQDSDYLYDDRRGEFSRSNNSTDDDDVMDYSLGAGLQFDLSLSGFFEDLFEVKQATLTMLGGYSYHEQNLRMTNGSQTIPASGSFGGLNSTYQTEWKGPWAGIELSAVKDQWRGLARFQYHWLDYYAEADWNLRSDFKHPKSYEHLADGRGVTFVFDGEYLLSPDWGLNLNADIKSWSVGSGIDRTFFSSGTVTETKLNEVVWVSYAFMLGLKYHFPN